MDEVHGAAGLQTCQRVEAQLRALVHFHLAPTMGTDIRGNFEHTGQKSRPREPVFAWRGGIFVVVGHFFFGLLGSRYDFVSVLGMGREHAVIPHLVHAGRGYQS